MLYSRHMSINDAPEQSVLQLPTGGRQNGSPCRRGIHALSTLVVAALSVVMLTTTGCSSEASSDELTVAGSTTCLPIAEIAGENFLEETGVSVLVSGLGSSAGIQAVSTGTADIATSSRDLAPEERDLGLEPTVIAHDGIAIIVNEDNPVKNITIDQLRAIYAGEIQNWSELGGKDIEIQLINRDEASGTREAFKNMVMGATPFDRSAAVLSGTGEVRDVVGRSEGAIGYISMGFVSSEYAQTSVRALYVNGIKPSEETVRTGIYPVSRDLYFFTKGKPSKLAQEYIDYVVNEDMDDLIREAGFVPVIHEGGED